MRRLLFFFTLIITLTLISNANTIHVPDDLPTIQAGLFAAAASDTVLVQPGMYTENLFWPDVANIKLISAGDTSNTVIDGDSAGIVIYMNPNSAVIDSNTIVRGFCVVNGVAGNGGGITLVTASPILENLSVRNGGGIACNEGANLILRDSRITGNTGNGIWCVWSDPTITNVDFSDNSRAGIDGSWSNATIRSVRISGSSFGIDINHSDLSLRDVTITDNDGIGINCVDHSNPTLVSVTICGNGTGVLCTQVSNPSLTQVIIIDNAGTGIVCYGSNPILTDVTISGNNSGIHSEGSSRLTLTDVTVTRNLGDGFSGAGTLQDVTIVNNLGFGIYATAEISGDNCNIINNSYGAFNTNPADDVSVTNSYWGHVTGPYHPAVNPEGLGDSTNVYVNVTPWLPAPSTSAPPIPVQNFIVEATGNDFISLSWDESQLPDLAGYRLYYDTDSLGYPYEYSLNLGSETSYTLSDLPIGTTYYIAVTCYDADDNESWYSNCVIASSRVLEVQNLVIGSDEVLDHVLDHLPSIHFDYYDSMGQPQSHYHIQLTTNADYSVIDMWDTGEVSSDAIDIEYSGEPLIDGNVYYLRARVASEDLWSDWTNLQFRMNTDPAPPVPLTPIDNEIVVETYPTLWISNSTDSESDPLVYDFQLSSDSDFSVVIEFEAFVEEGVDSTSWTVLISHPDNEQYWWRTEAYDGFECSEYSIPASFVMNSANDSPAEFDLLLPENSGEVTSLTPLLDWEDAVDPDPLDQVIYTILIGREIPDLIEIEVGIESYYEITTPLDDNALYYWKVIATDLLGVETESTGDYWTFVINTANDDPNTFTLITPTQNSVEIDLTPLFYWEDTGDPDLGDTLTYYLYYDQDSLFSETDPFETLLNFYTPSSELSDNSTYFWKVIAVDEEGWRATMESDTWRFWTNTVLEPPNDFLLVSPMNGEDGVVVTPTLVWETATDNDPNDYTEYNLFFSEDSTFNSITFEELGIADTTFTVAEALNDDTQYFWRVDAEDTDSLVTSSDVFSFIVGMLSVNGEAIIPTEVSLTQNYPNPFNPSTTINFSLPQPADVTISVYNTRGQLVDVIQTGYMSAGYYTATWTPDNLPSGIYFVELRAGEQRDVMKVGYVK
jgi:hypothetical protein